MKISLLIFSVFFITNVYSNDLSSNIDRIHFFVKKYESALTVCENKKSVKRPLSSDDLNILRSIKRDELSAFISYKAEILSEECIANNDGPSLGAIYSLRFDSKYNERVIIDNFIKLILSPSLGKDYQNYQNISDGVKNTLNSMKYFDEPFSMGYIASQIVGN